MYAFHLIYGILVDVCTCPPSPPNGFVTVCNGTSTVGDTVEYSCSSGYYLEGAHTRTCQTGGNWTERAPTCEKGTGQIIY